MSPFTRALKREYRRHKPGCSLKQWMRRVAVLPVLPVWQRFCARDWLRAKGGAQWAS